MMKIFLELPTWLGDSLMATPAIENLIKHFGDVEITLIGSKISVEVLMNHPKVVKTYILDKNIFCLFKILRNLEDFDLFFSFRNSLRAKFVKLVIPSIKKFQFDKKKYQNQHQVEKYNNFVNESLNMNSFPDKIKLYYHREIKDKSSKILGINPGASYGSAKRWYPKEFASVATHLSKTYDIVILGGLKEIKIAEDIEKYLIANKVKNYINIAGKTSIESLIGEIAHLDLLITGDSGPMHISAALQVPTVSIFGPTNDKETSQWKNEYSFIVKKNLKCQPCMSRICPLKHHDCMKLIKSVDVLKVIDSIT